MKLALAITLLMTSFGIAAERTFLMVDDHEILYRSRTRRVLEIPVCHAKNPLITVLDEDGYRVLGFDKVNCVPLKKKDTERYRFAWKEKKLVELPPGPHHIRLHLQSATVYAITLR